MGCFNSKNQRSSQKRNTELLEIQIQLAKALDEKMNKHESKLNEKLQMISEHGDKFDEKIKKINDSNLNLSEKINDILSQTLKQNNKVFDHEKDLKFMQDRLKSLKEGELKIPRIDCPQIIDFELSRAGKLE